MYYNVFFSYIYHRYLQINDRVAQYPSESTSGMSSSLVEECCGTHYETKSPKYLRYSMRTDMDYLQKKNQGKLYVQPFVEKVNMKYSKGNCCLKKIDFQNLIIYLLILSFPQHSIGRIISRSVLMNPNDTYGLFTNSKAGFITEKSSFPASHHKLGSNNSVYSEDMEKQINDLFTNKFRNKIVYIKSLESSSFTSKQNIFDHKHLIRIIRSPAIQNISLVTLHNNDSNHRDNSIANSYSKTDLRIKFSESVSVLKNVSKILRVRTNSNNFENLSSSVTAEDVLKDTIFPLSEFSEDKDENNVRYQLYQQRQLKRNTANLESTSAKRDVDITLDQKNLMKSKVQIKDLSKYPSKIKGKKNYARREIEEFTPSKLSLNNEHRFKNEKKRSKSDLEDLNDKGEKKMLTQQRRRKQSESKKAFHRLHSNVVEENPSLDVGELII